LLVRHNSGKSQLLSSFIDEESPAQRLANLFKAKLIFEHKALLWIKMHLWVYLPFMRLELKMIAPRNQ
jgi:hypothetical protein